MTDTDRLAALRQAIHERVGDDYELLSLLADFEAAVAQGVRVGDDGLRAAAQRILDRALDFFEEDDLDPESSFAMPVVLKARDIAVLRAALAAQPAPPALDREVIARWLGKSGFVRDWEHALVEADALITALAAK